MKHRYLYLLIVFLGMAVTACQNDLIDGGPIKPIEDSDSFITLTTERTDGVISLSIDAPAQARFGIWIDLDNNGAREEDGSEDVKLFNVYQEYALPTGINSVSVYGDITYLGAALNKLSKIDVSGNPFLTTLNVPMNQLTAIDLYSNTALLKIDVSGNNIVSLNVSSNPVLETLWVYNNKLLSLDVSNNNNLLFLDCSGNKLNALNVSKNVELVRLLAYNNELTTLDLSQNNKLNRLWLFDNPLSDTETEHLILTLNKVATNGELWITNEPLNEAPAAVAVSKGWKIL